MNEWMNKWTKRKVEWINERMNEWMKEGNDEKWKDEEKAKKMKETEKEI
jgi:hypothetical protein